LICSSFEWNIDDVRRISNRISWLGNKSLTVENQQIGRHCQPSKRLSTMQTNEDFFLLSVVSVFFLFPFVRR